MAAASEAEHHCVSGDVILNPAAWKHCDPRHFTAVPKEDGYMKINDILHFINPNKRGRPIVAHRLAAQLKQAGGEKQTGTTHDIGRPKGHAMTSVKEKPLDAINLNIFYSSSHFGVNSVPTL